MVDESKLAYLGLAVDAEVIDRLSRPGEARTETVHRLIDSAYTTLQKTRTDYSSSGRPSLRLLIKTGLVKVGDVFEQTHTRRGDPTRTFSWLVMEDGWVFSLQTARTLSSFNAALSEEIGHGINPYHYLFRRSDSKRYVDLVNECWEMDQGA